MSHRRRLDDDDVKYRNIEGIEGIEQWAFDTKISKYRDTTKYRYRTFASIAILRYIEYRTSTSPHSLQVPN